MITNVTGLPMSLAVWLAHDDYDHNADPYTVSATTLLKPIKSTVLSSRVNNTSMTDLMDLVSSRTGTAVHTAIENAWESEKLANIMSSLGYPDRVANNVKVNPTPEEVEAGCIPVYMELRGSKKVGKYTVTGKFDFISDGVLEDFKTTGTYNYINQSNKDKYIQQGSIYRWLHPELITADHMIINYIFTDWSAAKARAEKDYPNNRIVPQKYSLMSDAETSQFVQDKINKIDLYMLEDQDNIPPCTSEELWESPTVYKYYKDPKKKTRATKNFDNYHDAYDRFIKDGSVGEVVEFKGQVKFCAYCAAAPICKQAIDYVNSGRLSL